MCLRQNVSFFLFFSFLSFFLSFRVPGTKAGLHCIWEKVNNVLMLTEFGLDFLFKEFGLINREAAAATTTTTTAVGGGGLAYASRNNGHHHVRS